MVRFRQHLSDRKDPPAIRPSGFQIAKCMMRLTCFASPRRDAVPCDAEGARAGRTDARAHRLHRDAEPADRRRRAGVAHHGAGPGASKAAAGISTAGLKPRTVKPVWCAAMSLARSPSSMTASNQIQQCLKQILLTMLPPRYSALVAGDSIKVTPINKAGMMPMVK